MSEPVKELFYAHRKSLVFSTKPMQPPCCKVYCKDSQFLPGNTYYVAFDATNRLIVGNEAFASMDACRDAYEEYKQMLLNLVPSISFPEGACRLVKIKLRLEK